MYQFFVLFKLIRSVQNVCETQECYKSIFNTSTFEIDDRIALTQIINYTNETGNYELYSMYYPRVDEFTQLELNDENCTYISASSSTVRFIYNSTNETIESPLINYRINGSDHVTQFFSIKVILENGVVKSIGVDTEFDTGNCVTEDSDYPYRCVVDVPTNCTGNVIRTFLGFQGTDKSKTPLQSSQFLPSTFSKFGVTSIIGKVTDFFNKINIL